MAGNKTYIGLFVLCVLGFVFLLSAGSSNSEAAKIREQCQSLQHKEQCYAKVFENLTKTHDWNYSFAVLRELQEIDPEARGCHFIAHSITIAETKKDPSRWKELMNSAPQDCSYGAAHGALEVYASTFPDGKLPKSEIPDVCNNPDTSNCTHILGHLLLVLNEDDINESIKDCSRLSHDDLGKFECLSGVFMERQTAFNLVEHGLATEKALNWPLRMPELEELCRQQSGVPSVACWKEIVHAAVVKFDNNAQKIVDFCQTAPGEIETRECIDHSLGIIASGYHFELSTMKSICEAKAKADNFKDRCYAHLVSSTLSTVPQEIPSAVNFCSSIEEGYQESCFTMIGNALYNARPEHKALLAKECHKVREILKQRCQSGGPTDIPFYTGN